MSRYNENRNYEEEHERHTHNPVSEKDDWHAALAEQRQTFREEHVEGGHENEYRRNCPLCDGERV